MINFPFSESRVLASFAVFEASVLVNPKKLFIMSGQQYVMWFFRGSKRLKWILHLGHALGKVVPFLDWFDEQFAPCNGTTCRDIADEDFPEETTEEASVPEIFSLGLGFFGLTLFMSEPEGRFDENELSFKPKTI